MTSKEALKRLKQETCPATYMVDFDKNECIEIIKQDLERLEILISILQKFKDEEYFDLDNSSLCMDGRIKITQQQCDMLKSVLKFEE